MEKKVTIVADYIIPLSLSNARDHLTAAQASHKLCNFTNETE